MGFMGSEEFICLQFEEYLLALLSSVKYHQFLYSNSWEPRSQDVLAEVDGDPSLDFNIDWIDAWKQTSNYAIFDKYTDSHLFDVVEPKHPTAGGLSVDDINRRLTQQIQELHLDERLAVSKEVLNKHLATGQKKVSTAFNNLWADIEAMREAQRKRNPNRQSYQNKYNAQTSTTTGSDNPSSESSLPSPSAFSIRSPSLVHSPERTPATSSSRFDPSALRSRAPDLSQAQASMTVAGQKAGAYISSWGSWAAERRKGWGAIGKGGAVSSSGTSGDGVANSNRKVVGEASEKPVSMGDARESGSQSQNSSPSKKSTRTSPVKRKSSNLERKGGDGIGRLDA